MQSIEINIARDFSISPGPRYIHEGKNSGELFRKEILLEKVNQAISEKKKLIVTLDGTDGYGTSFLEEAFGGLIRNDNISYKDIISILDIISEEEDYLKEDVFQYLKDAHEEEI